jgi:N utilization substance protein B
VSGRTVSRRQERRAAFVLLYQLDVRGGPIDELCAQYAADTGEPVTEYARAALEGAAAERDALDARIGGAAEGWSVDRLGAVARAILRLAVWELANRPDVPVAVVIDEAVELTRRYATPEAARFVNGVLAGVVEGGARP